MKKFVGLLSIILLFGLVSCKETTSQIKEDLALHTTMEAPVAARPISEEFKKYWYAGEAEITSYQLGQGRYGEIREGKAVLVYVTEPFLKDKQVKADGNNPDNIPVLKLNSTKKYLTGIYPYSIMSSSFYPVNDSGHALKVSFSAQEWCGQVYAQLNNREQFEIMSHSYFESEGDQELNLDKNILENELWNKIRINPEGLPVGAISIIPSMEYIRLAHKELKAYNATATLLENDGVSTYTLVYPELGRTLKINFTAAFPHTIEYWEDSYKSGFGSSAKTITSKATKIKSIMSPYWRKNSNSDLPLRDTLGL